MGINEFIQIGSRIKKLRIEKGLSQKEMAKICGMPYSTYSNYENNNREPGTDQLYKIASVLGISVSELISGTDNAKYDAILSLMRSKLADAEVLSYLKLADSTAANDIILKSIMDDLDSETNRMVSLFASLNGAGQEKAIEQVELLTKIPEYRKEPDDSDTPK